MPKQWCEMLMRVPVDTRFWYTFRRQSSSLNEYERKIKYRGIKEKKMLQIGTKISYRKTTKTFV